MSNLLTVIILGGYTIIYIVVFFIQKTQIDALKSTNTTLKSFIDIFKVDEVKKYVELKSESAKMEAIKSATELVLNQSDLKKLANEAINDKAEKLKEIYFNQMGEEHLELFSFVLNVIKSQPESEREKIINEALPKTSRYFLNMLDDIKNDD